MKSNKGFTLIELSIAIVAVVLFAILVSNINYTIYTNSVDAKKTAIATEKAVEILEYVGSINIEDCFDEEGNLNEDSSIIEELQTKYEEASIGENNIININLDNNYQCIIGFDDYAVLENNIGKEIEKNILKIVTVKIEFNVGKNTEGVTVKRIITKK